jgi:hypothetical protein
MSYIHKYTEEHESRKRKVNQLIDDYNNEEIKLSTWQIGFLESIQSRLNADLPLSSKQEEKLEEIYEEKYG